MRASLLVLAASLAACAPRVVVPPAVPPRVEPKRPLEDLFDPERATPIRAGGPLARVHLIDVGQGAATLFELSCAAILIDTGGETNGQFSSADALEGYLDHFFARRADLNRTFALVVLTHPHIDHTRNTKLLVDRYQVKNVVTDGHTTGSGGPQQKWLQTWAATDAAYEAVSADAVGGAGVTSSVIDPVQCPDVDPVIRALWGAVPARPAGWTQKAFDNKNNHSVVLRVDIGTASFLVTGDLEEEGIEALVHKFAGTSVLDVDVYQVGHHGSHNGTTRALVQAMTPIVALIAMGPHDREEKWSAWDYGHPRKAVIEELVAAIPRRRSAIDVAVGTAPHTFEDYRLKKAIYGTGWDGTVVVTVNADGKLRVQTTR